MGEGIFHMCLALMAVVGVNQLLWASEKDGIVPEGREEILQRMKVREVRLRLHQLRLEKEIAELEAPQEALVRHTRHLERKMQRHTCAVLSLLVSALLMLRRQHWKGATAEHTAEGDADPGLLRKAWKGVALLTKPFVLLRAIFISMGRSVGYLGVAASRLVRFPLKLLRSTNKDFEL